MGSVRVIDRSELGALVTAYLGIISNQTCS